METVQEKKITATETMREPLGLYVHVPFCYTRCDFCAFYEKTPEAGEIKSYLSKVAAEADSYPSGHHADTVFLGGGTPGLLSARDMTSLGEVVVQHFGQPSEWSIEMAPASVTATKLRALKELGVNRISVGVQSFDDKILQGLGRDHSLQQIDRAYDLIRKEGFDSVNIDMMFALPGQTIEQWTTDLYELQKRDPDHVSTYCLTFEEDTRLYAKLAAGQVLRQERQEADFYEYTWDRLAEMGYAQYEVSNFSKEGHSCIHNLNTWKMYDWIGLGPSAASQYRGRRYTNVADLHVWKEGVGVSEREFFENELLPEEMRCQDALIFGLRLVEGVDLRELKTRFGTDCVVPFEACLEELLADQLITMTKERIVPTRQGMLLADRIGEMLLG